MNWDVVEGKWEQLKGKIRAQWGKLSDDDIDWIGGNKDRFVGRMQERYGYEKDRTEKEFNDFSSTLH